MPAGRPTRDDYGSLNTVLGALRVEPVECCSQLVGDLCQACLRGKGVTWQAANQPFAKAPFGQAGKYLLAAALPLTSVNVDERRM
jgi:hypothetical protein